MSPQG